MRLTTQQLINLRQQITLNSLFTDDYINSFDIPARQVQDFFDGYLEYCETEPDDDGNLLCDKNLSNDEYYNELFKIANNPDFLSDYYFYMFEEDPLSQEFFEKYYQNA